MTAGNKSLMTPELVDTLCDHAAGNYRVLTTMAGELLAAAAERECTQLVRRDLGMGSHRPFRPFAV